MRLFAPKHHAIPTGDAEANGLVPLGSLLKCPEDKFGKRFRGVLREIAQLHRVPPCQPINVNVTKDDFPKGQLRVDGGTGRPYAMDVSRYQNNEMDVSFLHETGHFVEMACLPGYVHGGRPWEFDQVTFGWQEAVKRSRAYAMLVEARDLGVITVVGKGGVAECRPALRTNAEYQLEMRELWARSYVQWVAERSGSGQLLSQVSIFRCPPFIHPLQWDPDDFSPIGREIDSIFRQIGWLP